jgi:hypothetical protein
MDAKNINTFNIPYLNIIDINNQKGKCYDSNATIGDRVLIRYEWCKGLELEFGTIKTIL